MSGNGKTAEKEAVVKEFVSKGNNTKLKKKAAKARHAYTKKSVQFSVKELIADKSLLALIAYAAAVIAVILLGTLVCRVPVVAVCSIVVIETLLAACLHNLPIWLHVVVIAAEILSGIIFERALFMVIEAVLYLAAIFALKVIRQGK